MKKPTIKPRKAVSDMQAVLISIQPKWCELIASGKKTVEIRKTKPKLETPFKCYIYETQGRTETPWIDEDGHEIFKGRGQVIGEFVCDKIVSLVLMESGGYYIPYKEGCGRACMTVGEAKRYGKGKPLYAWHITGLVIYDKPKDLIEFCVWKKCNSCRDTGYESTACRYDEDCKVPAVITRPPQSWCYVEERSDR